MLCQFNILLLFLSLNFLTSYGTQALYNRLLSSLDLCSCLCSFSCPFYRYGDHIDFSPRHPIILIEMIYSFIVNCDNSAIAIIKQKTLFNIIRFPGGRTTMAAVSIKQTTAVSRKVVGKKHKSARDETERWSG